MSKQITITHKEWYHKTHLVLESFLVEIDSCGLDELEKAARKRAFITEYTEICRRLSRRMFNPTKEEIEEIRQEIMDYDWEKERYNDTP